MPNMGGAAAIFKQASDPGSSAVAGDLWSDTDNEALYRRNDANDGWITLNSSEKADISPETVTAKINSTIADYSTPDSATASSFASSADWTFDGSATGWETDNGGGTANVNSTTSGKVYIQANSNGDVPRVSYDLYADLGDSNLANTWVLRYKVENSNFDNNASGQAVRFDCGMSSGPEGDLTAENPKASVDSLHFTMAGHGAGSNMNGQCFSWNSANDYAQTSLIGIPLTLNSGTFYVQVTRLSVSSGNVKVYSDAGYTSLISGWDLTISSFTSNPSNLRYFFGRIYYQNVSDTNTFTLSDIKVWNDTTTAGEYPASNAVDNNTSTYWQSNSETNPNIYVDVGSNKNISQIAIWPHSNTTSTEVKIQSSTNASAWTDTRKITYSNFTEGEYNYVRFNTQLGRYFRIYGTDGSAKVLAINEIKCEELSDGEQADLHGHLPISATSTAIALNGT